LQVYALQLAVFTAIAYPLLHTYAGSSFHSTPLAMAAAVAGLCLSSLASVDLFSKLVSPVDRGYAVIFACGGFMVSAFLFGLDPVGLFVWDPHNAMEAAKGLIETLLRRTMLDASPEEIAAAAFTPSPLALQLLYSIFAAVLTALLFAPALRFVRAYTLQQRPPVWAEEEFIKPHAVATARLHLHLVLPLLCAVTWVRPLFCDPLGLPERTAFVARAAAAIVTGIIMISNCRILAARYLDTALVAWWTLKHGAKRSSTNRANTGVIIQAKCEVVRRLMCKAAVQGIAPGAFILCCGLALAAFLPEDFTEAGTTAGNLSSLVTSVAGFLIWWTGCVWFLLCSGILWLFRTGTLQN